MSDPRRGRPPQRYALRRMRLVGFHNFVDETIEIRDGGHLFLLGDNGSGKTTVLDAIHLVLTGTLHIELNAAARIAGGREAGRSLQGICLRYDTERGVVNAGGAIAYAVLELGEIDGEGSLLAGIGIEATTMEADVTRWGFLARGAIADLPLLDVGADGARPLTRDALRARLGKADVFPRMSEYRRALAERLFGGVALYEEVSRFWSMAKAYREIVAKARDFAGLFARLLPAPNRETFTDILRSVRNLDELEESLRQVEEQRAYVAALADLVESIRALRETSARYRWLAAHRRLAEAVMRIEDLATRRGEAVRALEDARARAVGARARVESAEDALARALASDVEGLGARLREAGMQETRLAAVVSLAEAHLRAIADELTSAGRRRAAASHTRTTLLASRAQEARAAATRLRSLEAPLASVLEVLEAEEARAAREDDTSLPPVEVAALDEVDVALDAASARRRGAEQEQGRCEARRERAEAEVAVLAARREEIPRVEGFAAAREALASAGIGARPLFELLDPKPSAPGVALAALEELVGDAALSAFVVAGPDRDRARPLVVAHAGARLAVTVAADATLPPWIADLFTARTEPHALQTLATLLAQPPSLGQLAAPDALGDLTQRGLALRTHRDTPRLLGERARRRAHEERVRAARGEQAQAEAEVRRAAAALTQAATDEEDARRLRATLDRLRAQDAVEANADLKEALGGALRAAADHASAAHALTTARADLEEARVLGAALSARAKAAGLEELERRIGELRDADRRAREDEGAILKEHAQRSAALDALDVEAARETERLGALRSELDERARSLRSRLPPDVAPQDDHALETYVRVTQRGDQFKSVETIEERTRAAEREEIALSGEIAGDGSRGVRNLTWASKFGFGWWPDDARVEDRRGEPLPSVLAHIDKTLAEQREVVNERTRELMDRLVMGALARELQEHVERLHRTVHDMNRLLAELRFGTTRYQFRATPRPDRAELVLLVRKLSVLDEASRASFREFVNERLEELRRLDDDAEIPELLDYRRWFDYRLAMRSAGEGDTELTRELRALGSGGEQGVPNYLLVLALARLMFDNADARVRPVLFDEAFYGIDAGRRDQLLRFATDLGLQIVVASPDQDGVTPSARSTTTLFLVKDENNDVHLAPYHYWNDGRTAQRALIAERPEEPPAEGAVCAVRTAGGG